MVKQLFENGNGWKTLSAVMGIMLALMTISSWKFMAEARTQFIGIDEFTRSDTRVFNDILSIKADIREIKIDIKEILRTR